MIVFWSCEETERLVHESLDDAVYEYLDSIDPRHWPEKIDVMGYQRITLSATEPCPILVLESVLDDLEEEYGDPDGCWDPLTDKMKEAAKTFCDVIRSEYKPYMCEQTDLVQIDTIEWVTNHRPDWLKK